MKRILILLIVMCGAGFAQVRDTASIFGSVSDAQAAMVPGANVTLTNIATGQSRTATTDSSGGYSFPLLPVGTYSVTVEQTGF
ncbi:MAG: carboxypeptidase regulatory-like domain-containing protein, partial [Acidobacteria bacterium]|nr:carboxypeptidase regulatory-like domain-containing protein [Acidobacteriota bacterium]